MSRFEDGELSDELSGELRTFMALWMSPTRIPDAWWMSPVHMVDVAGSRARRFTGSRNQRAHCARSDV